MAARYSKHSAQEIHWTRVGFNAALQGLSYAEVRTKDDKINEWITIGMTKAVRKLELARRARIKQDSVTRPKVAVVPASQLGDDWRPSSHIPAEPAFSPKPATRQAPPETATMPQPVRKRLLKSLETRGASNVPPEPKGGWTIAGINDVIERLQCVVGLCPACLSDAKLRTYDYMTFGIDCQNQNCRLKVERGIVNERGARQCLQIVIAAWNTRPPQSLEPLTGHVARLVEAAQEANDWLSDTPPGSDQHERSKKLAKALKPFTQ